MWIVKSEKDWFNFEENKPVDIESILRSCFLNADRYDFPNKIRDGSVFTHYDYPEYLIERI